MAPVDFSGKYKISSSGNLEAYLDALGTQAERKQALLGGEPSITIVQNGDEISITYDKMNYTVTMVAGKECENMIPNGMTLKSTPQWEGDKLVSRHEGPRGTHVTTRELQGGDFVQTFEFGGVVCKRIFSKV